MNLTRAFVAMAALAFFASLLALGALGTALRSNDSDIIARAHGVLGVVAGRLRATYVQQIVPLGSDLALPLHASTYDGYGRRIVAAAIGDDEGIDGGLYFEGTGIVADAPQPVVKKRERAAIVRAVRDAIAADAPRSATVALPGGDVVAIDAVPLPGHAGGAFARERLAASLFHGARTQRTLVALATLLLVALIGIAAWIVFAIRRDARRVMRAIAALEIDPASRPALPRGDFGAIGRAVRTMAEHRAAAEIVAQRSERLAAIGRLAANAAHEIRNPLNALRLQAEVLRRRAGAEYAPSVRTFVAEIDRLDSVVARMLEAGTEAPVPARLVDLRAVAHRAIDVLAPSARARESEIRFACETAACDVVGDDARLVQLTINIIGNALDVAPAGSAVDVRIAPGPVLAVTDRGAGIDAAAVARIFEPFYTTKEMGTGLGLTIAHEIARAHGARIDVASRTGETTFSVSFGDAQP